MFRKQYIQVLAQFSQEGALLPIEIIWADGRRFAIDKILAITQAASLRAGGAGTRFTCSILGQQKYLFLEENRWFVEME